MYMNTDSTCILNRSLLQNMLCFCARIPNIIDLPRTLPSAEFTANANCSTRDEYGWSFMAFYMTCVGVQMRVAMVYAMTM